MIGYLLELSDSFLWLFVLKICQSPIVGRCKPHGVTKIKWASLFQGLNSPLEVMPLQLNCRTDRSKHSGVQNGIQGRLRGCLARLALGARSVAGPGQCQCCKR